MALLALAWVLSDTPRAERFLALTGLTPEGLRGAIGEPAAQGAIFGAVLDFLCGHEPDLVAAAESLGLEPAALAAIRGRVAP